MKLLEAEQAPAPVAPPEPPPEAPSEPKAPAPGARTCGACGAEMAPGQDWCLACGTAAPGRLGARPGWRAASTVTGLTAVLVAGAVAASYAALKSDAGREAAAPAPANVAPVPQPPPATPPAQTTPAPATPPAQTTPAPSAHSPSGSKGGGLPKVSAPKSSSGSGTPAAKPVKPAPSTSTPSTSTPSASTPSGSPGGGGSTTQHGSGTGTTTTPKPAAPTRIALTTHAGTVYDPYQGAAAVGDASKALDGKPGTSWFVESKTPGDMGVGYVVDVGKLRGIREIRLATSTPGFRVEVYATDEAALPPDILDTRWSHIKNRSDVDGRADTSDGNKAADGKERIVLGSGSSKYRQVLLWFTRAPKDGPRIKISELQLLG